MRSAQAIPVVYKECASNEQVGNAKLPCCVWPCAMMCIFWAVYKLDISSFQA